MKMRFTREQIYDLCPDCARDMKDKGIKSVVLEVEDIGIGEVTTAYFDEENAEIQVKNFGGFSKGLCDKFGADEGFFTRCAKTMQGKVDDSKAFCASLHKHCVGKWPGEKKHDEDTDEMETKIIELAHSNAIRGVEIFAAGTHNKIEFTDQDLEDMVTAFKELDFRPALKIGHTKDKPGAPSFGWVTNLRKVGSKLLADFESMHDSVVEAVRKGLYDRVSSEIYFNLQRGKKLWRRALKAVALLGADVPAVANLVPLHKMEFADEFETVFNYDSDSYSEAKLGVPTQASIESLEARVAGIINFLKENDMAKKNAQKIAELKLQVEEFMGKMSKMKGTGKDDEDEEMKKLKKMADDLKTQITSLEKEDTDEDEKHNQELKARDVRIAALEKRERDREVSVRVDKIAIPALRPAFAALYSYALTRGEEKIAVFTMKDGKEIKQELTLAEVAESIATEINEQSKKVFSKLAVTSGGPRKEGDEDDDPSQEADRLASKLMREKPETFKSYTEALAHVFSSDPELEKRVNEALPGTATD